MRILFVSGTTIGGSGRSQRELANRLVQQGHSVWFLVDDGRTDRLRRWWYGHLSDLAVRVAAMPAGRLVRALEVLPGRKPRVTVVEGLDHFATSIVENAVPALLDSLRPHVVVGNSITRLSWRKTRTECRRRNIATVLYIREVESLNHFDDGEMPADCVVANAQSLTDEILHRGFECRFIPSVIELGITLVESTRQVALAINPIESRGVSTVWAVAERMPHIRFVVQVSWPLSRDQLHDVRKHCAALPNVELREAEEPGPRLYRDSRVLLVPYRVSNRPRVILEAQSNGIPIVAAAVPALGEAIGDGGLLVGLDDIDAWCAAIERLCTDEDTYDAMSRAALRHSHRPEVNPEAISREFATLLDGLVSLGAM